MAIKYESSLKWGDIFYLKNDPDQFEHCLTGIILLPGKPKLILSYQGSKVKVYECETSREPNKEKMLGLTGEPPGEDVED